jgi:hypothetical protein
MSKKDAAKMQALIEALQRIERETRGYDDMCTMGILNEIAKAALGKAAK